MSKKIVAVLDVGSSSIKAVVSERGVNNTFSIKSEVAVPYEGFAEGQFFDLQELSDAISDAVMGAFEKAGKKFKEIYVGVPGVFVEIENKKIKNSFGKQKRYAKPILTNSLKGVRSLPKRKVIKLFPQLKEISF